MKHILLLLIAVWVVASGPPVLLAQNTPFSSPALDSNCYFPQIGIPGQIDTLYGTVKNQYLGSGIKNLGPKPDGSYGNLFIENLDANDHYTTSSTIFQIQSGSSFNLHQLKTTRQRLSDNTQLGSGYILAHFRDRSHLDMFVNYNWRIYWADDQGNYDSTRFSQVSTNIRGDGMWDPHVFDWNPQAYIAHLTSDSVDDIVLGLSSQWTDYMKDTVFLALYSGGSDRALHDTLFEDTSIAICSVFALKPYNRRITKGDFRGVGREDLLFSDDSMNWHYFKNDPPFTLEKFAHAMLYDTLLAKWQNPHLQYPTEPEALGSYLTMRALPKPAWDKSVDLLPVFHTTDDLNLGIFFFRGGPDFGSHRLTLDSAAYVIRHPKNLDPFTFGSDYYWPETLTDAGDMTGTGNRVLDVTARNASGDYGWENFYVLGRGLDERIDLFDQVQYGFGYGDSLTVNGDSLEDYVTDLSWPNAPNDPMAPGGLKLYYGTKDIPVHLNSKFADVQRAENRASESLVLAPNPVTRGWSVAMIVWPEAEEAEYKVYDMLGRLVDASPIRLLGGAEEQRIYLRGLVPGTYLFTIIGSRHTASRRFVNLSETSGSSGAPTQNFMQSLRDARDGRMAPASVSPSVVR
ncbi:MAG: T9SS type A sorting domain-containing protein [Bacteroidota bacterium]|nr:T9SS type A sorting domain-containing protein [Bacteroidota bacterium]MDP4232415.1 T9SS type A sorting domain-containing protein [Bacteroidota bacterium]MDP4241551.1 T9SS type A sorting domain-containing protein [Bacteroidota bacterium]MDP4288285.1 T9SS type A sorting domain-containing protein [Bacteroidota bacterium]